MSRADSIEPSCLPVPPNHEPPGNTHTGPYDEFTQTVLSFWNQLHCAARRLTGNSADAEDLVQDTYRLAFEHHDELRSLGHCRAWLYRILHRQAVTRYRRQHSGPRLVLIDSTEDSPHGRPPATIDDDLVEQMSLREIRAAIETLPHDLQVALTLCDIEGFPYAEIAEITDTPLGTVRSRIARARMKLMRKLQPHAEECGIRRRTISAAPPLSGTEAH